MLESMKKLIFIAEWIFLEHKKQQKKRLRSCSQKNKLWSINRTYDSWFLRDVKWMPRICGWKKTFLLTISRSEKLLNFARKVSFFMKPSWSFLNIQKGGRDTTWIGNESAFCKVLSDCFCFIKHQSNKVLPSYTLNLMLEYFFSGEGC